MRRFFRASLCVGVLVVPAMSPAAAADREHQQMMAELRMLQEQATHLQLALGELSEAVKTVAARLDDHGAVNRKGFADQKALVDNVAGDVRILREKLDDTNLRISTLSQEVDALRLAIPAAPSGGVPGVDVAAGKPAETSGAATGGPVAPGTSPKQLWDQAYADYTIGQWALAITGFDSYIKTFPKSPVADDAQYYIGETYYNDGKFKEAVAAYDRLIADYPDSNVLPDAYYKRGVVLDRLGETARARESYETVFKRFPDTSAGGLAKQALDRLNRPSR